MSGNRVKGTWGRVIESPGYHIHPQYYLHHLRRIRFSGAKHEPHFDLPLTSMIDMFSMLVIFLLMNFSSTGEVFFIPTKDLIMPEAQHGRQLETAPLITIARDGSVRLDSEAVGSLPHTSIEDQGENLAALRMRLQQMRAVEMQIKPNVEFKGQINIQADEQTTSERVKKVMVALIQEGWTGINFAVRPPGDGATK